MAKVILLWGPRTDSPLLAVEAALARRGAPSFFLDQARVQETETELRLDDGVVSGRISLGDACCSLEDITAVYPRATLGRRLIAHLQDDNLATHADRLDAEINDLLDLIRATVINPAAASASNGSKPYQLALIARHGFAVPDTLVTTDPTQVAALRARHKQIIYKSVSGIRSIVSRFSDGHAARLEDIAWFPHNSRPMCPAGTIGSTSSANASSFARSFPRPTTIVTHTGKTSRFPWSSPAFRTLSPSVAAHWAPRSDCRSPVSTSD